MRRGLVAACCVLAAFAACRKPEPAPPPQNSMIVEDIDYDRDNLLNIAHGASVVSRTAEVTLENSAAHAIDGDWLTFWKSSPGGPEQTFVFSLPARSRIDRLGLVTSSTADEVPPHARFEASNDGSAWREVAKMDLKPQRDPQLVSVAPFEATYLRVRTEGISGYYSAIRSVIARGRELAPPEQPSIDGCWTINGMPSRFVQRGTSVTGVIGSDPPMYVSGGTDGRVLRLMWLRAPMWGLALVTLDPQRRALSGVRWHEEVKSGSSGDGWFGTPCGAVAAEPALSEVEGATETRRPERAPLHETEVAAAILQRAGKWIAYGDSALDTLAALIARTPGKVVVRTRAQRDALRSRGIKADITVAATKAANEPQRVIADGVALYAR